MFSVYDERFDENYDEADYSSSDGLAECEDCGHLWDSGVIPASAEYPVEERWPECPECGGRRKEPSYDY